MLIVAIIISENTKFFRNKNWRNYMKLSFNSYLTCAVLAAHHRRQCSARWTTSRAEQHSEDIHARHGARGCSTEWRIANQMRSGKYLCLSAAKRQTRTEKENTRKAKIVKQQVCFHHFPPLPPPSRPSPDELFPRRPFSMRNFGRLCRAVWQTLEK